MVDSDGGIDIQVQPLTGTGGRTHGRRAGSCVRAAARIPGRGPITAPAVPDAGEAPVGIRQQG